MKTGNLKGCQRFHRNHPRTAGWHTSAARNLRTDASGAAPASEPGASPQGAAPENRPTGNPREPCKGGVHESKIPDRDRQRQPDNGAAVTPGCRHNRSAGGATQTEPRPSGLGDAPPTIGFKPRRGGRADRLHGSAVPPGADTVEPSNHHLRTQDPHRGPRLG